LRVARVAQVQIQVVAVAAVQEALEQPTDLV
jgi:hypothetical protein